MEVKLPIGDIFSMHDAVMSLLDAPFAQPSTAVKFAQMARTIQPLFDDASARHNALIDKFAPRDEEGHIVYANAEKTRVKPDAQLIARVDEFLSDTIEVSLPSLDAGMLGLEDGKTLSPAALAPFVRLMAIDTEPVTLTRAEVVDAIGAFAGLIGETFAADGTAPKIAKAQVALVEQAQADEKKRRELAIEHGDRDEAGELVYLDAATKELAITPPAAEAIAAYFAESVEIGLPKLTVDELTLSNGKGISPRRLIGLTPILSA